MSTQFREVREVPEAPEPRRLMRVLLGSQTVLAFIQGRTQLKNLDLPADVRAVAVMYDFAIDGWQILLESEQFEPVPFGEEYPRLHLPYA